MQYQNQHHLSSYDIIIIGAGAAGLMAAATAGKRKKSVLLLDHATKLAEKIRISGGGRCNFTNLHIRPEAYLSENKHFCRSALAQYTQQDFIDLLKKYHIEWHEKTLGQLFCHTSSQQIIDMLDHECQQANVKRLMDIEIQNINQLNSSHFLIQIQQQNERISFECTSLIIATGGLALPQLGATPFGYRLAEQFGLKIIPPVPALVPLALHSETLEHFSPLSGVSLDVEITTTSNNKKKINFREKLLFTHKGISGPAVLQISSYWQPGQTLIINLMPEHDLASLFQTPQAPHKKLSTLLIELGWPKRFTETWLSQQQHILPHLDNIYLKELSSKKVQQLIELIHHWPLLPNSTLGYKLAEVTRGGVDTHELDSKTMMAKKVPGLYFAGEVIDVTGWLGGYNFQWAWSSGYVAGMNA